MASINDENYRSRLQQSQQVKKSAIAAAASAMGAAKPVQRRAFQNITNTAREVNDAANHAKLVKKPLVYREQPTAVVEIVADKKNKLADEFEDVSKSESLDDETEEEMLEDEDEIELGLGLGLEDEEGDEDEEEDEYEQDVVLPFWAATVQDANEIQSVGVEFSTKPGIWDDDDEDTYDISMVAEYGPEIFQYMKELESDMLPDGNYMDRHDEIHWGMRKVLLDWIVQVHGRFHLLPETLFLAVNYMDRFLTIKSNVSTNKLQLVGAVALFIAAKYEEINCPSVQEMVYMVENLFSAEQILKAEQYMINLLEFKLGWPGPMSFLRRTSKADDYELEIRTLAKYLLEITIMDQEFVACPPSYLAAAAHCMSRIMLERAPAWSDAHVFFAGYTFSQLKPGLRILWDCCKHPEQHHKAIYQKYQDRRFRRASLYVSQYLSSTDHELPAVLV